LRHPDIVAFSPMLVKALCSPFVVAFVMKKILPPLRREYSAAHRWRLANR